MMEQRKVDTALRQIIVNQGRKQEWLKAQLGISKALMSYTIFSQVTVPQNRAEEIARLLGVPLESFYDTERHMLLSVSEAKEREPELVA